jgi:hypothetical protein
MVNPRHVRLYMTLFGFGIFGGERHYPRGNAPAVALRVDVRKARKRFRAEHTDGFSDAFACRGISLCSRLRDAFDGSAGETGGSNPLDSALARRIIAGRTGEFASLAPQCLSLIARLYPAVIIDRA